jgi:Xaa-Pro aminopeptidase
VDCVGIYNGYIADATRIFSLGKLEASLEEAYQAACRIEELWRRSCPPDGREGNCSSFPSQRAKNWATWTI